MPAGGRGTGCSLTRSPRTSITRALVPSPPPPQALCWPCLRLLGLVGPQHHALCRGTAAMKGHLEWGGLRIRTCLPQQALPPLLWKPRRECESPTRRVVCACHPYTSPTEAWLLPPGPPGSPGRPEASFIIQAHGASVLSLDSGLKGAQSRSQFIPYMTPQTG